MAKKAKAKVNKSQAVRDYLKDHAGAKAGEISAALTKQGITITPAHVANIKSKANAKRTARKARQSKTAVSVATPAATEAASVNRSVDALTIQHVRKVAQTVTAIGGFDQLKELLAVVHEVGGLKRFRDLLEAMEVNVTDQIPY